MASTMQFVVSVIVVVILVILAIALGHVHNADQNNPQAPPALLVVGATAFVLGAAFMALANVHEPIPAVVDVIAMLVVLALGSLLFLRWSHSLGWSDLHSFAVAAGLLLVYAIYGFVQVPSVGDTTPQVDTIGNVVFALSALVLLVIG